MTIEKIANGSSVTLKLIGRLDTSTVPDLDVCIAQFITEVRDLVLDCSALDYVSSSGLRILLKTQKLLTGRGSMKLIGVNENIMEIFNVTGFADILTIE